MTYANQLTILRMLFIPCFVLLLLHGHALSATLVFVVASLTDGLDGLLARKLGQRTVLGSYLDPMADKLLLTASFIVFTVPSAPLAVHLPVWLTVLTISRDLVIALSALIIRLRTGHSSFPPSMLGKCTTAAQLVLIANCLAANLSLHWAVVLFHPLVYLGLFLTLASGMHYAFRSIRLLIPYRRDTKADGETRNQDCRG